MWMIESSQAMETEILRRVIKENTFISQESKAMKADGVPEQSRNPKFMKTVSMNWYINLNNNRNDRIRTFLHNENCFGYQGSLSEMRRLLFGILNGIMGVAFVVTIHYLKFSDGQGTEQFGKDKSTKLSETLSISTYKQNVTHVEDITSGLRLNEVVNVRWSGVDKKNLAV